MVIIAPPMFKRTLKLPTQHSFWLWGARQTGKTTLLKQHFKEKNLLKHTHFIDLLLSEEYRRYRTHPERLREEVLSSSYKWVVIDEVQKIPNLLSEIHWLMENTRLKFALCGSSVRQLKKTGVHLLGGRALRYELFGLTKNELKKSFHLTSFLNRGYLPAAFNHSYPKKFLSSYISDYLKQEIASEALVRNLTPFSDFLEKAALSDTEIINYSNFARDCGVSSHTIKEYYSILSDTLLGTFLPSYKKQKKRRVIKQPKFYFFDIGIVNSLTHRFSLHPKNMGFGKAFENWIFHELKCTQHYHQVFETVSYFRLTSGVEVDFILDDMRVAIEVKSTSQVRPDHLKGLRTLTELGKVGSKILVCCEDKVRKTSDGIWILPYAHFLKNITRYLT